MASSSYNSPSSNFDDNGSCKYNTRIERNDNRGGEWPSLFSFFLDCILYLLVQNIKIAFYRRREKTRQRANFKFKAKQVNEHYNAFQLKPTKAKKGGQAHLNASLSCTLKR
jgi:hypothetical protein